MEVEGEDDARMRIHMTIVGETGLLDWNDWVIFAYFWLVGAPTAVLEPLRVILSRWPERSPVIMLEPEDKVLGT